MTRNHSEPLDSAVPRRSFLAATVASVASASAALGSPVNSGGSATVKLSPAPAELMRVRIEVDVKGNVKVSDNPLVSQKTTKSFPISSNAVLDYEERPLRPANASLDSEIVAAERFYHRATSTSLLNKTESKQELRDSMRRAVVRRESLPELVFSEQGFYTHDELSLLRSPISSVSVERLLPTEAVTKGDRYEVSYDALSSVLNLTSVDSGTIGCSVLDVTDDAVRFKLEGDVEGSVEGVTTRLRLIGKMTFDRKVAACSWLAMAVHETRDIGKAEPGFDVSATIRMVRRPMKSAVALTGPEPKLDFSEPATANKLYAEMQSRQVKVGAMMDRRWRLIQDAPGSAVMRMIENDTSVAQCNMRPLVKLPAGKQWTLEAFEADVRQTLGKELGQLIEGDQRVSAQGLRVLRIVADGETQGVPIRWIMMHFSDDDGNRVLATFTMSGDKVTTFAGNDSQLADSLRFLAEEDFHQEAQSSEVADTTMAQAPRIATRPSSLQEDENATFSASDLR